MITSIVHVENGYNSENDKICQDIHEIRCLSTDTKPSAPNGSECIEIDTGKIFLYDAEGGEWHEI